MKRLATLNYQQVLANTLDYPLLILAVLMMSIGLVMITSSSLYYAEIIIGDEFYFFKRHSIYLLIALGLGMTITLIPINIIYKLTPVLLLLTVLMLVMVLVPGIGKVVNGSRRWIDLGLLTFQVAEAVKVALILFVASYLTRRLDELRTSWKGFIKPLLVMAIIATLLLFQPDFGSVVVLVVITIGMLFIAGVPLSRLTTIAIMGIGLMMLAIFQSPYRLERLTGFMNPWQGDNEFGSSYQLAQSLIAYGNGEWFGVGLGNSMQKLFYLPEAHTDFIVPIIAEELGFVGVIIVLSLMVLLVINCLKKGAKLLSGKMIYTQNPRVEVQRVYANFSGYICFGAGFYFAAHATVNVAMSLGLMPTKGLTLPFISYGGSSLLMATILLAVVIRIHKDFKELPQDE